MPHGAAYFLCAAVAKLCYNHSVFINLDTPFWWGMHIEKLIGRAYGRDKNGRAALESQHTPAPQAPNERKQQIYVKKDAY
jgi:hypothetical protein